MFAVIDAANLSFLPVYAVKKGLDQATASLALTAFIVGNTVLQFPIGWLADHFPKRWVMAGCGVVTACAAPCSSVLWHMGILARAHHYRCCVRRYLYRFTGGTGRAVLRPRAGDRHRLFSTTWGLGALVGSLIAGWSMHSFGPDGLPYSMALIFALFLVVMVTREVRKNR